MNRLDTFTNILIRWIGLGALFGALAGGACGLVFIFGVLVFGILGLVIGLVVGLGSGIVLGMVLGIYIGAVTCMFFFPLNNNSSYKRLIILSSTLLGFIVLVIGFSLLIYPREYSGLSLIPSVIAVPIIASIASRIADWYIRMSSSTHKMLSSR